MFTRLADALERFADWVDTSNMRGILKRVDKQLDRSVKDLELAHEVSARIPAESEAIREAIKSIYVAKEEIGRITGVDAELRIKDEPLDTVTLLEEQLAQVRQMTGAQFEQFMADVMRELGYQVRILGGSGDQGVDVIAQRASERIAIQCKQYDRPVGNKPVQEVFAGSKHHRCTRAVVAAPAGFTQGARALAKSVGVELYDAASVREMIRKIDSAQRVQPARVEPRTIDITKDMVEGGRKDTRLRSEVSPPAVVWGKQCLSLLIS